jgi:hypothetical protein
MSRKEGLGDLAPMADLDDGAFTEVGGSGIPFQGCLVRYQHLHSDHPLLPGIDVWRNGHLKFLL